jgi:predicted nucleic acid-binding protein
MIALDTNILIYSHRAGAREHDSARRAVLAALDDPRGWGICLPTVSEFWSVVTHPSIPGGPTSPKVVTQFFHYLVDEGGGNIWTPGPGFAQRLMEWAGSLRVRGRRIFDLQIAVIALEHGVKEIWTHDVDFISVPGVKIHDPLNDSN